MRSHTPVLLEEVLSYLSVSDGGIYLDCTFGAGGYTKNILSSANCCVYAIDQDPQVLQYVDQVSEKFKERFKFLQANFCDLCTLDLPKFDGIVFDLGVSSMQLDNAKRGFSFQNDAVLDMRMDQDRSKISAYDIINNCSKEDLEHYIGIYGDERDAKKIVSAIIKRRKIASINSTKELTQIIESVKAPRAYSKINPATKTFQGIRIAVNDELGSLQKALYAASDLLLAGGVLLVVTFHSGEDKIVKEYFKSLCKKGEKVNKYKNPKINTARNAEFSQLIFGVVQPSHEEVRRNPRSRSAKLRGIRKYEAKL